MNGLGAPLTRCLQEMLKWDEHKAHITCFRRTDPEELNSIVNLFKLRKKHQQKTIKCKFAK